VILKSKELGGVRSRSSGFPTRNGSARGKLQTAFVRAEDQLLGNIAKGQPGEETPPMTTTV